LGGNTSFYKPILEGVWYLKHHNRLSLGLRAQYQYVRTFGGSRELPIFEKLFLGGEYSVRGFDIRTIGPSDCEPGQSRAQGTCTGLVTGGNKSLLFNIEELISIAGPVRLVLFYDAGQVQPGPEIVGPPPFTPDGQFFGYSVRPGKNFTWRDFKTSTGLEVRFFMPVLNVPFRLIYSFNPQREGVLDNNLRPAKSTTFRFAVGTTF
jgi:outer membrane protein insertion porin family